MSHPRRIVLLCVLSLAAAGCGSKEKSPLRMSLAESHRLMLERLAKIATVDLPDHPFIGDKARNERRARLDALPKDADPLERFRLVHALAQDELRLGNVEVAMGLFDESRDLLGTVAERVPPSEGYRCLLDWAVSRLRFGETTNCVAMHRSESCMLPIGPGGVHTDQRGSRAAIDGFLDVLENFPGDPTSIWLLNIAAMTVGEHPDKVPPHWLIPREKLLSSIDFPHFPEIASKLGLSCFDLSGGSVVEDLDGDGLLDILTSTWDTRGPMHYYKNDGNGHFTERTEAAGLKGELGGINMAQADYDNDGDVDVMVFRGAWISEHGQHPDSLLANDGHGRFTDVTFAVGLGDPGYPSHSGAWADYDLDGDLDLYVGSEAREKFPYPSQLFRNEGNGTFTDVAAAAGVLNLRYAKGVTWGDYDGDRYPDLYVSNLYLENRLYKNQGNGTFRDVAPELGVTRPLISFPTWFWDFDNDGALDLFVSTYEQDMTKYVTSTLGLPVAEGQAEHELQCLYRGDGHGGFTDVTRERGLERMQISMGSNFGDLDNDGFLDFYLGTGFPAYEALMPKAMYLNQGGQRFVDVSAAGGFANLQKGHGVSFADLDNDGDQDVFEQMGGAFPGDGYGDLLYENPGCGNHWIKVKLVGTRSNRCGIGSRIKVDLREGASTRSVYLHVDSGGSFGCNPLRKELGLGRAEKIERLEVYWPASDTTQVFDAVPLDSAIEITEGKPEYRRIELARFAFAK